MKPTNTKLLREAAGLLMVSPVELTDEKIKEANQLVKQVNKNLREEALNLKYRGAVK